MYNCKPVILDKTTHQLAQIKCRYFQQYWYWAIRNWICIEKWQRQICMCIDRHIKGSKTKGGRVLRHSQSYTMHSDIWLPYYYEWYTYNKYYKRYWQWSSSVYTCMQASMLGWETIQILYDAHILCSYLYKLSISFSYTPRICKMVAHTLAQMALLQPTLKWIRSP